MTEYRTALQINSNDAEAHKSLAWVLAAKGDSDNPAAEYRSVLHLNPKDVRAHFNLGQLLYQKHDADGAIAEFRTVLQYTPNLMPCITVWVRRLKPKETKLQHWKSTGAPWN